jgi:plasmid stability protein
MRASTVCIDKAPIDLAPKRLQNSSNIHFGAEMPNLSVKDVPEAWAETLRQRAARNHRSLQGELMAIIESAVREPAQAPSEAMQSRIVGYDRFNHPVVRHGWKTIEQVAAELHAKYPEPVLGQPLGVDIIREERDAR